MIIAITGANGFVGNNLCKHFLAKGYEVKALIRKTASTASLPASAKVFLLNYDDKQHMGEILKDCDVLVHNAGKTKARTHYEMLKANCGITEDLISVLNTLQKPLHFIYISSQAVAGPVTGNNPLSEENPPNPISCYGKSKLAAETVIQAKCRTPWTIVRPCSVYGCGDRDFLSLFKMVKSGLAVQIGKQDKLLNMIHVSELAEFLELCVVNPQAKGQIFAASDGKIYTQREVVLTIAKVLNKKPLRIVIPLWLAKQFFYTGHLIGLVSKRAVVLNREKMKEILADGWLSSPQKAQALLNWNPEANLTKHLKETAECYQKLGWL